MSLTKPFCIPVQQAYLTRLHEVDWDNLEFGKYFTDHMLVCDYSDGEWQQPQIIPFGDFRLSPVAMALHYGQTIFEGMKVFRMEDGAVNIFRPHRHYERMVLSCERMCMPVVPREVFIEGLQRLVELDKAWVPGEEGSALYIRPFMIATEARLRVKVSESYRFAIVATPTAPYEPQKAARPKDRHEPFAGIELISEKVNSRTFFQQPVRVKVERDYVRASRGGTGYAKCGGNYGASMYPTQKAREEGYDQVLWTDSKTRRYIEESGAMNVFFVIDGMLVTPPLSDSILDGVTRDSLIRLAIRDGIPVSERPIDADELKDAFKRGGITEAFGAGTAAVISPIGVIGIDGRDYTLPAIDTQGIGQHLKDALDNIRYGREADTEEWNFIVK